MKLSKELTFSRTEGDLGASGMKTLTSIEYIRLLFMDPLNPFVGQRLAEVIVLRRGVNLYLIITRFLCSLRKMRGFFSTPHSSRPNVSCTPQLVLLEKFLS